MNGSSANADKQRCVIRLCGITMQNGWDVLDNPSGTVIIIVVLDDWVWRSLVACLNGVQEAGSSNLLTQTSGPVAADKIANHL